MSSNNVASQNNRGIKSLLVLLVAICLVIAWFGPVRQYVSNKLWPPVSAGPRDAHNFIALAYTDTPQAPQKIDSLNQHLDILKANGYVPITLDDVVKLLHSGTPVPRKSVLLTIDSSDRKFVAGAKRAVRRHGWRGVLFVDTADIGSSGKSLSWAQLKKIANDREWEIGLQGYGASRKIQCGADADQIGNFLTSRRWLADKGRLETDYEFQARIAQAYQNSLDTALKNLGLEPRAFAYPDGDFGQHKPSSDISGSINLKGAASFFNLAFTEGRIGMNSMFSDPVRLNRLRVGSDWSSADLIHALDMASQPISVVEDTDFEKYAPGWIADRGEVARSTNGIVISTSPELPEARAWLAGSDLRNDFRSTVKFSIVGGAFQLFLRAAPDNSSFVEIRLNKNGAASVFRRVASADQPELVASTRLHPLGDKPHVLDIYVRNRYLSARLDQLPIFSHSIRVPDSADYPGRLGCGTLAKDSSHPASVIVTEASDLNCKSIMASWDMGSRYEPYIVDWFHRNAGRLTMISPPWKYPVSDGGDISDDNKTIYKLLARIYKLQITPGITINSDTDLKKWSPAFLAKQADEYGCDGVYVNFENNTDLKVRTLQKWLRQTSNMFSEYGRVLLVRLPPMLEQLATVNTIIASIPAVELVTGSNSAIPSTPGSKTPPIRDEHIEKPDKNAMRSIPEPFAIAPEPGSEEVSSVDKQIKKLRDTAENFFQRGAYDKAIAAFDQWHQLAPQDARPLTRIGDALVNQGYSDEAATRYQQSLDIEPGQVDLAVRLARLLTGIHRTEAARELLNAYARLFPDNTDILLAQAEWLYNQDRTAEARRRIDRILAIDPDNFDASLFLLRLASDEHSRAFAVDRLMALSTTPQQHYKLVNAVWQYDLLTLPNSHLLINILNDIDATTTDPRVKAIISKLRPRTKPVIEDFSREKKLSDSWQIDGTTTTYKDNKIVIRANPTRTEFTAHLLRSERWRDSYIQVNIAEVTGSFWLYARRSRNRLVRFGFEPGTERVYLQVWRGKNNDMVVNRFVPWTKPKDNFTLRLEVRGDGIKAAINGKPAFDVPLALPKDFGLGWSAFAVSSRERGTGKVALSSIEAGPLPVRLALLPPKPPSEKQDDQLEELRKLAPSLTDFSPAWYAVDSNSSWSSSPDSDNKFFKLFAHYYRLRMVPTVTVADGAKIQPEDVLTITRLHNYDGLVLLFDTMPAEKWFDRMDRELGAPGLDLLAVSVDEASGKATMRGIASSRTLFQGAGTVDNIPVFDYTTTPLPKETNLNERAVLLFH